MSLQTIKSKAFAHGGDIAALINARDWSDTPLGPIRDWPQSLRSVVDLVLASPVAMIVLWGPDLIQIYNAEYGVIAGPRHPSALGQRTRECWPEVWQFNKPIYDAVFRGGTRSFEAQLLTIERLGVPEEAWFDLAYSAVRDDTGIIAGVLVTVVEITRQVLAERKVASEVARQRRLFEQAPGFICILAGPDHVYEFGNEAYEHLVGRRDFIGKSVREALPDIEGQGFYELLDTVYATGEGFVAQHVAVSMQRTPGGPPEERFIDFTYAPIIDESGHVTGIFTQGHDVTDAHTAKEALGASEARLLALNIDLERQVAKRSRELSRTWHVSPDLMGILTSDGYFEHCNPAWLVTLGWTEAEIRQKSVFELMHPDDVASSLLELEKLKRGVPVLGFENRYPHKAGGWRWLSWVVVPEDGKFHCSARDITESKDSAAELQVIEMRLRQAQKMEAVGQLTGGIAHDFNNMLSGVIGGLDIIQRRLADKRYDDIDRFVEGARQSGQRAASLVLRLMAFSRQQVLKVQVLDPSALARNMDELLRRTLGINVTLTIESQPQLWAVTADASQLENALLNLAINARDAMPEGGDLTITTTNFSCLAHDTLAPIELAPGDYVVIRVSDTGTGMPQAVVDRAFDPFFTTKAIGQGTGLGLSMIYGFAKQSNGHVTIVSSVGEGTTITLYLPRSLDPTVELIEDAVAERTRAQPGQTVLVVDDEAAVRLVITDVLTELNYSYLEAADGDAALALLRTAQNIDLLITDVGLPGIDGRQLSEIARQLRPGLKVLFVTGYAGAADFISGALGADVDVIAKPFAIDALGDKVLGMTEKNPPVSWQERPSDRSEIAYLQGKDGKGTLSE
ncbi:MAG: response regulator [Beijerinckiaceae bacterium]